MKLSFYVVMLLLLVAIFCCSLFSDGDAESRYYNINHLAELYADPETGVVYYLLRDLRGATHMMCMCPRYNADGTLYVMPGY